MVSWTDGVHRIAPHKLAGAPQIIRVVRLADIFVGAGVEARTGREPPLVESSITAYRSRGDRADFLQQLDACVGSSYRGSQRKALSARLRLASARVAQATAAMRASRISLRFMRTSGCHRDKDFMRASLGTAARRAAAIHEGRMYTRRELAAPWHAVDTDVARLGDGQAPIDGFSAGRTRHPTIRSADRRRRPPYSAATARTGRRRTRQECAPHARDMQTSFAHDQMRSPAQRQRPAGDDRHSSWQADGAADLPSSQSAKADPNGSRCAAPARWQTELRGRSRRTFKIAPAAAEAPMERDRMSGSSVRFLRRRSRFVRPEPWSQSRARMGNQRILATSLRQRGAGSSCRPAPAAGFSSTSTRRRQRSYILNSCRD